MHKEKHYLKISFTAGTEKQDEEQSLYSLLQNELDLAKPKIPKIRNWPGKLLILYIQGML